MIWRAHTKITSKRRELKKENNNNKQKKNYRQLALEHRERALGFKVRVVPLVISALGGGIKETKGTGKYFETNDLCKKIIIIDYY